MNNNFCTHRFKRGKRKGEFCTKKTRTKLDGKKPDYLCCKHSKRHIPEKMKKIENFDKNNILEENEKDNKPII